MTRFGWILLALLLAPVASAADATPDGWAQDIDTRAPPMIDMETFLVVAGVTLAVLGGLALAAHAFIVRRAAASAGRVSDDQRDALQVARTVVEESA